jgi:hypothetical protein
MRELVARRHETLCYNAAWFRAQVALPGADFRAYPEPISGEGAVTEALGDIIKASHLLAGMSERLTPIMLDEMARERPDAII